MYNKATVWGLADELSNSTLRSKKSNYIGVVHIDLAILRKNLPPPPFVALRYRLLRHVIASTNNN